MQGKGKSLRLSLMALVVVLIFGALGGLTLAKDAFDADYDDCPAVTRLDAINSLTIDRTDEDDEIRVSWDALDSTALSALGPNGYRARLTIIVEGEDARNVALGDTNLVVGGIDFTKALTVSVAVTLAEYVISDIAEADFTSGMPAPRFSTDIRVSGNKIIRAVPGTAPGRSVEDATRDVTGVSERQADGEIGADIPAAVEKAADDAEIALLRRTAEAVAAEAAKEEFDGDLETNGTRNAYIAALIVAQPTGGPATLGRRNEVALAAVNALIDKDDRPAMDGAKSIDLGTFYYLGFNHLFDNWYYDGGSGVVTKPSTPKFRIGLQHGSGDLNPGEADFENYRIVIEDSSGDLLGYQAETVSASRTYGSNKIVFNILGAPAEAGDALPLLVVPTVNPTGNTITVATKDFTNVRLSNQVSSRAVSPYYGRDWVESFLTRADLSYGNVGVADALTQVFPPLNTVYGDAPVEFFDFPSDVFESDGSYTIKAWAEDDDGTRISPQASIVLSAQEGQPVSDSIYLGYSGLTRAWATGETPDTTGSLTVYGFSIQDE